MQEYDGSIKGTVRISSAFLLESKDFYTKKDVATADSKRFLRNIAAGMGELGYKIDDELRGKILNGELGESAFIRMPVMGVKMTVPKKRNPRLLAGIALTAIGIPILLFSLPLGLLATGAGELSLILWLENRGRAAAQASKQAPVTNRIWLLLEHKGHHPREPAALKATGAQPARSLFTVHAAGESSGDKKTLQSDIKRIAEKLESFA